MDRYFIEVKLTSNPYRISQKYTWEVYDKEPGFGSAPYRERHGTTATIKAATRRGNRVVKELLKNNNIREAAKREGILFSTNPDNPVGISTKQHNPPKFIPEILRRFL